MNKNQQWTSKLGFILAAAGASIGLGAIWKFPYMAGNNGGGAFFILFLLFTLIIGVPLLLAEFIIGRSTQKEAISAYKAIAPNSFWSLIGRLGMATASIVLSFYSVVGGWIMIYLFYALTGKLWEHNNDFGAMFGATISNPYIAVGAQFLFLLCTIFIVSLGVQKGLELANKYMMPLLFVLFIVLIVRSLTFEGAMQGVEFLLKPDFSAVTAQTLLDAMGQALFSLTVGASVMITYSSYLSKKESLTKSTTSIVSLTIIITLLAGLAIFPAIFAMGMQPAQGPDLLFIALPYIFANIPFGKVFFVFFLVAFFFATLTSAISMLEITVSSFSKNNTKKRPKIAAIIGLCVFVVGIPSALSFGLLSEPVLFGKTVFDLADFAASNIMLPLGALLIALFAPLKVSKQVVQEELSIGTKHGHIWVNAWYFLIRFVVPIAVLLIFLNVVGVFSLFN
ncbi:sodium-dependent transporter [Priestia taiwanensis]|uniref:Transporter n=1 Tax=Priestia taiwanensis TaxID=1347902 RepID=A0A917APM9_9BACI|nr:sodium-dependent transporter [Priestia taiwanensis]MBM7362903.1 NSS family neurotransmitter:Na+ symporter [Priestia taiwanensis]GGE66061.1 sodium-dependent transporter [Priestia taiwanensis]